MPSPQWEFLESVTARWRTPGFGTCAGGPLDQLRAGDYDGASSVFCAWALSLRPVQEEMPRLGPT